MSYILPQVQVFQEFGQLPQNVIANLNAFVVGPHYQLFRHSVAAERELIGVGAYDPEADAVYPYPNQPAGSAVDLDYVKLVMENVWALYANIGASENTPLVCLSRVESNKLRAVPRIGAVSTPKNSTTVLTNGVALQAGGCIYNSPTIPEAFYFFPQGGDIADFMSVLNARSGSHGWTAQDAVLQYRTESEGQEGVVPLRATDNPLSAGTVVPGPFGLVLDLDVPSAAVHGFEPRTAVRLSYSANPVTAEVIDVAGTELTADTDFTVEATATATYAGLKHLINAMAGYEAILVPASDDAGHLYIVGTEDFAVETDITGAVFENGSQSAEAQVFNSLRKPVTLSVRGADATSYFTISVDPQALPQLVDAAADHGRALKVQLAAGALNVTHDPATNLITVTYSGAVTLDALRDALVGHTDVAAVLDMSAISGDGTALIGEVLDDSGTVATPAVAIQMIPDAFRIRVLANDVTWKTGNGYAHSPIFKSRGVVAGDRIRYSVTVDDSAETFEGETMVADIEPDMLAPFIENPTVDEFNDASDLGDLIVRGTGLDIVQAGADNQRQFDGAQSKVYALKPEIPYFPGDYVSGVLSDIFTVTITTGGPAGNARARVRTASGNYSRINVPIMRAPWTPAPGSGDLAVIYLGMNLWMTLEAGSGEDGYFQVGDTFTFSRAVQAPWSKVSAAQLLKGGAFGGPVDTTYVLEVTRGGVFNRKATVIDGIKSANVLHVDYTGQPSSGESLAIDGVTFCFGASADPAAVLVSIGADADASFANLAHAINGSVAAAYATVDAPNSRVLVRTSTSVLALAAQGGTYANWTIEAMSAELVVEMDFDAGEWLGGNQDDEYVLRCTRGGTLTNAQFAVESQRGDVMPAVVFTGSGDGSEQAIGTKGVHAYFELSDPNVPFTVGDEWIIRVLATVPQITITDTAGIDQGTVVEVNDGEPINLGLYGATVTFDANRNTAAGFGAAGGLALGDVYYVVCRAAAEGPFQTLVLSDDLPKEVVCGLDVDTSTSIPTYSANYNPSEFSIRLYLVQAVNAIDSRKRQLPPNFNWTAAEAGVTVHSGIQVQDSSWANPDGSMPYLPVAKADLAVEYRALIPTYSDTVYSLNDIADVATTLGTVHPDNPLAQGVFNALSNSGDQPVYFMSVPSNDLAGYSQALDRVAKVDTVYGMCVLSRDPQVLALLEAHINAMSGPEEKRWRIGFVGTELPVLGAVYNASTHPLGGEFHATITDDPGLPGPNFTIVEFDAEDATVATRDIKVGDKLRCRFTTDAWGEATYSEFDVARVLSNTKIKLASGPAVPANVPTKVEVWHPRSSTEIATAVASRSAGFASRRMYHVFPDTLYLNNLAQTSEFAAAALVGLVSSVPPQQGLTNIEVNGFDDVPAAYSVFNRQQLNEMAGSGTFIIMQDSAGGKIYVRHQVSTATADGNLLTTELSITKNLDAISYYFANVLAPYIGRYNITDVLLNQLYSEVKNGMNFLGSDYTAAGLLGPMLILGEDTRIRSLEQHPTLRDHVVIVLDLELPIPLNVIQLRLVI